MLVKFCKLVSVVSLFAGAVGAVMARENEERRRFVLWLGAPGVLLCWTFGFLLAEQTSSPLLSGWVLASIALSLLSLQAMLFLAARASQGERTGAINAALVIVPLFVTLALMVWKP